MLQEDCAPGSCFGFHSGRACKAQGFCSVSCFSFCNIFPFEKLVFLVGACQHPSVAGAPLAAAFFSLSYISSSCSLQTALQSYSSLEILSRKPIFFSVFTPVQASVQYGGKTLSGRYLRCIKPQMRKTLVWDHLPSDFYWQMFLHRLEHCVCTLRKGRSPLGEGIFILNSPF